MSSTTTRRNDPGIEFRAASTAGFCHLRWTRGSMPFVRHRLSRGQPLLRTGRRSEVVRLAVRQRWQTKSGPPGRMRIRDWMNLDTGVSLFPNSQRDNIGETAGLAFADYGWSWGNARSSWQERSTISSPTLRNCGTSACKRSVHGAAACTSDCSILSRGLLKTNMLTSSYATHSAQSGFRLYRGC